MNVSGVIHFQGEPVCYELLACGGFRARILGHEGLLPNTDELSAAIAADQEHQRAKRLQAD